MKHFKTLSSQHLQKKRCSYEQPLYFPAIIFATLLGTYLDLYFTGIGMYSFPNRPFGDVFSIHIIFNLVALPIFTWIFLYAARKMARQERLLFVLLLSMAGPLLEIISESQGFFVHSSEWRHWHSFFGYFFFLIAVWIVFIWTNRQRSRSPI
ncbi:group-specific protein [Bacillus freudenreichii]|nr:group-specific protein [Bacillus freudenreichii]